MCLALSPRCSVLPCRTTLTGWSKHSIVPYAIGLRGTEAQTAERRQLLTLLQSRKLIEEIE
jgi:hypothetical protein